MKGEIKDFIKENWFRLGLLILVTTAILFYLLYWWPDQKREKTLANNIKCQQEGSQLFEREKNSSGGIFPKDATHMTPEFRFISELNACLYKGGMIYIDIKSIMTMEEYFIKDVYANQTLGSKFVLKIKGEEPNVSGKKEEYDRLLQKYFLQK